MIVVLSHFVLPVHRKFHTSYKVIQFLFHNYYSMCDQYNNPSFELHSHSCYDDSLHWMVHSENLGHLDLLYYNCCCRKELSIRLHVFLLQNSLVVVFGLKKFVYL